MRGIGTFVGDDAADSKVLTPVPKLAVVPTLMILTRPWNRTNSQPTCSRQLHLSWALLFFRGFAYNIKQVYAAFTKRIPSQLELNYLLIPKLSPSTRNR